MRVLLPVHIYLPEHHAGVEGYTAQLAERLGHDWETAVVTTRKIISRPMGHITRSSFDGRPLWEVVNHLGHDTVDRTWNNPVMEEAFARVLDEFQPDVVHFQHLMYWSSGLCRIAKERGARVFLTLHDFWLMCSRMGQLVDPTGSLCDRVERRRCAACMARTPFGQGERARRWIRRLTAVRKWTGLALDEPMRWLAARGVSAARDGEEGAFDPDGAEEAWLRAFDRRREAFLGLSRWVDAFLSPSADLRRRFVDWGLPGEKFLHLPQGRDGRRFQQCRPHPFDGTLRLGYVGTVAPHKGVLPLVEAVMGLKSQNWSLDIWGPHSQHMDYWNRLVALAAGDQRIRLHGVIGPEKLPQALGTLDLLCVPSLWNECCPLTIQEAFMAGLCVLASDLGGMRELVQEGRGGAVAAPGDVTHWRARLEEILNDPGILERWRRDMPPVPGLDEHVSALRTLYLEGAPSGGA